MTKLLPYIAIVFLLTACEEQEQDVTTKPAPIEDQSIPQTYASNWVRVASPKLESDRYISGDGVTYSGSGGGLAFYAVDRNTNLGKPTVFYPDFGDWDSRFYQRDVAKDALMRFGPFNAGFTIGGTVKIEATLTGGGYYKQPNGNRFYLKDFRIEGIDGYTFSPAYPGTDAVTSSFGLNGMGYVLENKANGKMWRFDPNASRWEVVSTVPIAKEARFVSFDVGERAFILVESDNWNDELGGLYEFIPATNSWQKKTQFTGENRRRAVAFTSKTRLYYGAGQSAQTLKPLRDIWEYNPATDSWQKVGDYPGSGTVGLVSLWVGNQAYIGFGQQVLPNASKGETINDATDFWRFKP